MATAAQVTASRANGALSHGPTSEEGKANSSRNALKTGLTGRTVLLPSEDAALYESHLAQFRERYQPVGDQELALVQSLADTEWRLARIPSLEMAIYAIGRLEFADLFPGLEEDVRKQLIEAKTFLAYQRQLVNLGARPRRTWPPYSRSSNRASCKPGPDCTKPPNSTSPPCALTSRKHSTPKPSG